MKTKNTNPEYRTGYIIKLTNVEDPNLIYYVGQGTIDYHRGIIREESSDGDLKKIKLYKHKNHAINRMNKIIDFDMFVGSYGFWNYRVEYVWIDRSGNIE